eukprot:CAMPEP_0119051808 /NCGR_PEP_ID=MMETSP1177-20130426/73297_1 /TAXON_ID=2985 /ORGANISM="Ochromonas sp, Strain CCMP1899" /LENGTH=56 /DNA_ID=CAMNT_0007031135 /DNA_START=822 /DNA_END=992 /DNA_ORIENTATION=-
MAFGSSDTPVMREGFRMRLNMPVMVKKYFSDLVVAEEALGRGLRCKPVMKSLTLAA